MKRIEIKHSETPGPLTWRIIKDYHPDHPTVPVITCSEGHESVLRTHDISASGEVSPSLVCPIEGCSFHEYATLKGWNTKGQQPKHP